MRIRGVRPRGVAMIAAVAVQPEDGPRIVDGGPPEHDDARKAARKRASEARTPTEIEGVLRQVLHGPKGEVRGLLLEDGRSGRFPPQAAQALGALLRPGTHLVLRGEAFSGQYGTVVAIRENGTAADNLRRIDPKSTKGKHDKGREQGAPEPAAIRPACCWIPETAAHAVSGPAYHWRRR